MSINTPLKPYKPMTPFGIFVKTNFPFIEATYEARDNYDLLGKVVQHLNTVEYNQGIAQENIQTLYNFLDTLDLQDEVNNKLDEMAQDGTLTDLIGAYIDPIVETQNDRITSVENQIQSVTSGAPAGVYATLTDLETADPNHSRIYVVTATGYWYYYNTASSEWTAGGVYQASVNQYDVNRLIEDYNEAITTGRQLYNKNTQEEGYYYDYRNGGTKRSNANWCNNTVDLKAGDTFSVSYYCYISYYTEDGTFIDGVLHGVNGHGSYTVPANTKIVRISLSISNSANFMVQLGTTTTAYEDFYYKFTYSNYIEKVDNYKQDIFVEVAGNTKLKDVLDTYRGVENVTIYVNKDIDIISELGQSFCDNYTSSDIEGYLIGSGVHLIFAPNTVVTCNYTGNNSTFITRFSPFASDKGNAKYGFTLENCHIIASKVRYCVHDELYNRSNPATHKYINCNFELNNANAGKTDVYAIGCGSGLNCTYIFENCIFSAVGDAQYIDRRYGVFWHTSVDGDGYCMLIIKDNYFTDGIYLATGGTGTVDTKAIISNNSMSKDVTKGYNSGYENDTIDLMKFNNVIRP